ALASYFARRSSIGGVVCGSGPSSNVMTTPFLFDFPLRITGKKKPIPGKKGAIKHSRINSTKGITDNLTSIKQRKNAAINNTKPNIWDGVKGKRNGCLLI
ncbi:MAG: hypothetical protein MUP22_06045, partial [Desulfobacterales bacterium]|nr:hypothetical protein [Desulfobacterales bacterium]